MINFLNLEIIVEAVKLEMWLRIYLTSNLKMLCCESEDPLILSNSVMNISATDTNLFLLSKVAVAAKNPTVSWRNWY